VPDGLAAWSDWLLGLDAIAPLYYPAEGEAVG
jgi:hypothetical protein